MMTDDSIFKQAMHGVVKLGESNKIAHQPQRRRARLLKQPKFIELPDKISLDEEDIPSKVSGATPLFYARDGLQKRLIRQLKRGQFPIDAVLDLHGYTLAEAENALNEFIHMAASENLKCLCLVHGKGFSTKDDDYPKLKNFINQALRHFKNVLAFCSAQPKHGGTGAVYVLLTVKKDKGG